MVRATNQELHRRRPADIERIDSNMLNLARMSLCLENKALFTKMRRSKEDAAEIALFQIANE